MKDFEKKIIEILSYNGIVIDTKFTNDKRIIDMESITSLSFISTIVSIEKEFGIIIPDSLLEYGLFESVEKICNTISQIMIEEKNERFI